MYLHHQVSSIQDLQTVEYFLVAGGGGGGYQIAGGGGGGGIIYTNNYPVIHGANVYVTIGRRCECNKRC